MKKFLLTMAVAAATLAASAFNLAPVNEAQLGAPMNLKKATPEMVNKLAAQTVANRAPQRLNSPVTVASDLQGSYVWDYETASSRAEDPSTVTGTAGSNDVLIYGADDAAGTFKIAGMFDAAITGTLDLTTYQYPTFSIADDENVCYATISVSGNSVALNCSISGLFYYEGDDTNSAGWYYTDNVAFVIDGEILWATNVWLTRIISHVITEGYSQYEGYYLTPLWKPGSTFTEAPEAFNGLTTYNYGEIDMVAPSVITEDEDYVVSVTNFAGLSENPLYITLEEGRTWTADHTVLFTNNNGSFVFYGLNEDASELINVTGTGTDTELTFGCTWTGYDGETSYWLGQRNAATITLLDGVFTYPGENEPDPAMYLIGSFNNWDPETQLPMTLENGKWVITQEMEANAEFKFRNEKDEWIGGVSDGNFIVTKEQVEEGTEITLFYGEGGMNFQIPVAGTWTLTVDPETGKLVIAGEWNEPVEETHLYILGNVGDQEWDPSVGTEMEATDDNVFEYTGTFNDNSYFSFTKKLAETSGDWDAIKAYRVGATSNDFVIDDLLGEPIALGEWATSADNAFLIAGGGEYTITVDLTDMVVTFTKTMIEIPVEAITLNYTDEDDVVLEAGATLQLTVSALPAGAIVPEVIWTSSDENVATIDENGLVTAKELPVKEALDEEMNILRVPAEEEGYYFVPVTLTATVADAVTTAPLSASVTIYVKGQTVSTGIEDVNAVNGNVTYVNVMGHTSSVPFQGVNIIMRNGKAVGKVVK
ncbi:MAG: Ig-like domain-containing protein [Muribaculaceae bacterium]|nr:Ig-like domain-containing protein [Muribaculaceae bacterium]